MSNGSIGKPICRLRVMNNKEIAKETLAFIDMYGLEAVSFRKISQATGVPAMTICNRFGSKENLLKASLEIMLSEYPILPQEHETWDENLRRIAHCVRNMALAHPRAYWLFIQVPPFESPVREFTQSVFDSHKGQGIPDAMPYEFLSVMHSFLSGFQIAEGYANEAVRNDSNLSSNLGAFARMFNEEAFDRDLTVIINGFAKVYDLLLN